MGSKSQKKNKKREQQKNTNALKPYEQNKLFDYILLALLAILIVFLTSFKISGDDDVFWHLATGRYVVETGTVPSMDVFGYVTQGQEWMPFEWGWDVLTYGLYNVGGYTAISVFRSLVFLAVFALLFIIMRRFRVSVNISVLVLLLLAFGCIDRFTPRPHIISFLFFAVLLFIITSYRYFHRDRHKVLYFIPVIFLIWANMHMGILAGLFLFGVYILAEVIIFFKPGKFSTKEVPALGKPELVRLLLIFLASLLVLFINPNGFSTYIYAYNHTQMKMLETINEWRSPFGEMFSGSFVTTIYKIFLFSGVLVLYYAVKKKDLFAGLLVIGFAVYSVRAIRFTVDYNIIISVFVALTLMFIIDKLKEGNLKLFLTKKPFLKFVYMLFIAFCLVNIPKDELYLDYLKYYRISGFGVNDDFIPVQMFDFMKENEIIERGENPLNHFGTGGYLVWNFPGKKNFIDSRNLNDSIFNEYNSIIRKKPGFEEKLENYNIDYAFYLAPDLVRAPGEMQATIISYFSTNPGWKLIFWDDKSFLFVKDDPKFQDVISKYEYKYATPYNYAYNKSELTRGLSEDPARVKAEIERKKSEEPNGFITNSIQNTYGKGL